MPDLDLSEEAPTESRTSPLQVSAPFKLEGRLDLSHEAPADSRMPPLQVSEPFNPEQRREEARGDLARGLLWLLTFAIGGVLAFVGLGRLDGTVITQSVFPSLIALAGTALGFYFGSQSAKSADSGTPGGAARSLWGGGVGASRNEGAGQGGVSAGAARDHEAGEAADGVGHANAAEDGGATSAGADQARADLGAGRSSQAK